MLILLDQKFFSSLKKKIIKKKKKKESTKFGQILSQCLGLRNQTIFVRRLRPQTPQTPQLNQLGLPPLGSPLPTPKLFSCITPLYPSLKTSGQTSFISQSFTRLYLCYCLKKPLILISKKADPLRILDSHCLLQNSREASDMFRKEHLPSDQFKQFIQLHTPVMVYIALFTVSYFLSNILSPPGDGRRRNLESFYLFSRKFQISRKF